MSDIARPVDATVHESVAAYARLRTWTVNGVGRKASEDALALMRCSCGPGERRRKGGER